MATDIATNVQPMDEAPAEKEIPVQECGNDTQDERGGDVAADGGKSEGEEPVPPKKMVPPSKVVFRLDNGTVANFHMESKTVELLTPDDAYAAGALKEEHLLRIQSYLCAVHAKLPNEGPLKSVSLLNSSKRSIDTEVFERGVGGGPGGVAGAKRAKSMLAMAGSGGMGGVVGVGTPNSNNRQQVGIAANAHDLRSVANRIFRFVKTKVLKQSAHIFQDPVDSTIDSLKDYYDIVPHGPISFSIMERKLENNEYGSPRELFDDMFKMCDNCYQYNMVTHPDGWDFGVLGILMEHGFMKAWMNSPFAKDADPDRKPRPIPSEDENPNKPVKQQKPARSSSVPRQASRSQFGGGGGGYGHAPKVYMTAEMENDLVSALNTPEILEANMEAVVGILQATNEMGTDEDGEPSLDLEKVSAPTKRKLYDLVVGKKGATMSGGNPTTSGFQMDDDDDFDDE